MSGKLKNDKNKIIASLALAILLIFSVNATFKHFFWSSFGSLYLSGPPYDRIILLPLVIVFPSISAINIWLKTKNVADAVLAWILAIWVFALFGFPEPKYSLA